MNGGTDGGRSPIKRLRDLRRRQSPVAGLLTDLAVVLVLLLVLRVFFVEGSYVLSDSMEPTLLPGDWLLTDRLFFRLSGPRHGDIVVFDSPLEPGVEYVKRLIALPGDELRLEDGRLLINDSPLEEGYLQGAPTKDLGFVEGVVPAGYCVTLGDNRPCSKDSRSWGYLPLSSLTGRVELVYFSYKPGSGARWGRCATVPP
ncbi:MAG: signal peptidase I [Candidatus Coatesbacteria bacterium]|nr:signal peptidase I [Candidatus Coatesbacteria bacterium]